MKHTLRSVRALAAALTTFGFLAGIANAATVAFTDIDLASGNPVTIGGVTLTTMNTGGSIGFIGSGQYTGLHLGGSNTSGQYTLSLSQPITSIEIEFDAASNGGSGFPESLTAFATNLGIASITYTNQLGTTFDGTTITSTINDGQGIINFSGPTFSSFSFQHNQGAQAGFVIERLVVNVVPEPSSTLLLGCAALGFVTLRRRNR